jgi:hypothetical protein
MSCNCNETPTYNKCNKCKPCTSTQPCDCPVNIQTKCVTIEEELPCSDIPAGTILTEALVLLDAFICKVREDLINSFTLKNIGLGAKIYKGVDTLGRKELRTITKIGNLITVTENADDVAISIDENALDEFIEDNQTTYSANNIGTGIEVYAGETTPPVGDNVNFEFKTITSSTLSVTSTDEEISINISEATAIPALYVNDLYEPSYNDWFNAGGGINPAFLYRGEGTLAKPFTNSRNYSSTVLFTDVPDSAIQNALDGHPTLSYVSPALGGTRLSPNRVGEKIKVQNNTGTYTFAGDFGYSRLDLEIDANINHTGTGYLFDMDNALHFNTLSDMITVRINDGFLIVSEGDGLNNSGSNVATFNYSQTRTANLLGGGTFFFPNNNITKYVINSDATNSGNNNDGGVTFVNECKIRADYQGILKQGGVSRVYNYGLMQSSVSNVTVDVNLKAYLLMGGQFRNFKTSTFEFTGARIDGFTFTPTGGFTPSLVCQSSTIVSLLTITNLFNKTNNNNAFLTFNNSDSSVLLNITNIFESTNLWSVVFNSNIFETGSIDPTKADLTSGNLISASNQIGANIIETLRIFNDRADAIANSVPLYSAYIKTNGIAYPTTAGWLRDIVLPA